MKLPFRAGVLLACLVVAGCGGDSTPTKPAPPGPAALPPSTTDLMRAGDKITVRLEGVPDGGFVTEMQIPPSGDLSFSYLDQPFRAAGQTPSQLGDAIATAYKTQKIYTNPIVTVIPEERYINVGGDVRSPSNIAYRPDSTVMSTINACGGFTEFADRRAVRIIRGGQSLTVDCVKAALTPGADPPVYPGDQIYVPRTMF